MAYSLITRIVSIILLLSGCIFFIKTRKICRNAGRPPGIFRQLTWFPIGLWLLLAAYQSRWQLFGYFNDDFLRVQRGFDARGAILKSRFIRGTIFDARRHVLAIDEWKNDVLVRHYPTGAASVHLVGYHHALFGSSGLEKALNNQLMGRTVRSVSDFFRVLKNIFIHSKLHGNPVSLTVYRSLQERAAYLLRHKAGAIVVIDPRDGSVLAATSSPGFDPERLSRSKFQSLRKSKLSPFINRCLSGLYPPGSTFKTVVSETALKEHLHPVFTCTRNGFDCGPGEPPVRDYQYYATKGADHAFKGHGKIGLEKALVVSCNTYFAFLGTKIGGARLLSEAHSCGFDAVIEPAGPGLRSAAGKIPSVADLTLARCARISIGQDEILVTPLHLALLAGAIGNGGIMYHPRFVENAPVSPWKRIMDSRTATELARMMIRVVESGTGHLARVEGIIVGGKTGTSETSSGRSHALFMGFAPWPKPVMAFAVVVEHAGTGGRIAAPMAARMIRAADDSGLFEEPSDNDL